MGGEKGTGAGGAIGGFGGIIGGGAGIVGGAGTAGVAGGWEGTGADWQALNNTRNMSAAVNKLEIKQFLTACPCLPTIT